MEKVKERLHKFYSDNNRFKKHKWDARRARDAEYRLITESLPRAVGGNIGRKRDETNKVVIGVGLGFPHCTSPSILHESFQSYFVQKARSLGYIVVGVNEYYTSKKCPTCEQFVGEAEIRRLYCKTCKTFKTYMHRDVMSGHNICNVIRGYLLHQRRPAYLQPVDDSGNYPWEQAAKSQTNTSTSTSTSMSPINSVSNSSISSMASG
ncbi:hypothetical protein BGZ54_004500 [Gamsiella multidivaricata]|nr:hypothetical protein BGZ54_004500 [Gamsiella multidivaricata]